MKIGIFGGSFNPPHKMHEEIANYLIDHAILDRIIFVPTGNKYQYKNNLLADEIRYKMLQLMISSKPCFEVSDYEFKDKVVYTYETLAYYQKRYPENKIYFICGSDNLSYIDTWKNAQEILKKYQILVVKRDDDKLDDILTKLTEYRQNIHIVNMPLNPLSSTIIREKLRQNDITVKNSLNENIYNYIKDNNLYKFE